VEAFPNDLQARLGLSDTLSHLQQNQEEVAQLEAALLLDPDCIQALNNLAWIRATARDEKMRNGALAVRLAERACNLTHYQQAMVVGTLAAAYAEAGKFQDAISTAQKACDVAGQNGEQSVVNRNLELLESYRQHRAYHETAK